MRISIAERLRPFCHVPGTSTILPGCGYEIQIFPCLIRIYDLKNSLPLLLTEITLDLKGPVQQFTICNDLEKGRIAVSGKTDEGWIRYYLISAQKHKGVRLWIERTPGDHLIVGEAGEKYLLHNQQWLDLLTDSSFDPYQMVSCDRLSLGSHKAQDWELVKRRFNLTEILPLVHRLGQLVPSMWVPSIPEGTLTLLADCRQSLRTEKPEKGKEKWKNFLLGCFNNLLVPQLKDIYYQGFVLIEPLVSLDISPLVILSEGARLIRQLFVQEEKNQLSILPYLLPSLHAGRLLDVPLENGGWISLEWTKKTIRRLVLYTGQDQEWTFRFRSDVRSYRIRQYFGDKGERKNCHSSLFLTKNCHYLFDNFQ